MAFTSVHFRTFVHATEDEGKVVQAMRFVSGLEEFEWTSPKGTMATRSSSWKAL